MRLSCILPVLTSGLVSCAASAGHGSYLHPKILWNAKPYPAPTNSFELAVRTMEFSPDGEQIVTGGFDGAVKFLNRSNGAVALTILAHTGAVHTLRISRDGLLLATGGADRMLHLWRTSDGTLLRSINAHTSAVYSVAFSPDASLLISGGGPDNQLKVWRTVDGEPIRTIYGSTVSGGTGGMLSVDFAPNGQYVAGSGMELWNLDGTSFRDFRQPEARTHVRFSADSTRVFATVAYGMVGYSVTNGTLLRPCSTSYFPASALSSDGRSVITVGLADLTFPNLVWALLPRDAGPQRGPCGEIKSWVCFDGDCLVEFRSVAFDPRMQTFATGTLSGEVMLFELPIWISGIQRNGDQLNLQWQGGTGSYQIQKWTAHDTWEDVGGIVPDSSMSITIGSSNAMLRVRNAGP